VSDLNFIKAPHADKIPFTIMETSSGTFNSSIVFEATNKQFMTASGIYGLEALGGGNYQLNLLSHNSQAARNPIASVAVSSSQMMVSEAIFDHIFLDSNKETTHEGATRLMPQQFGEPDRKNMWVKPYYAREDLSFDAIGTSVDSDAYGVIAGYDMNAHSLGGLQFVPTIFAAINGGRQTFDGVSMNQYGGQIGVMGSLMGYERSGISAMTYGGLYENRMGVAGISESVTNWFVGGAVKAAYNFEFADKNHATGRYIIQPNVLVGYNYYGSKSFDSSYGNVENKNSALHGSHIAPGVAAIYGQPTWNVFGSVHYMLNQQNDIRASVSGMGLPKINAGGDYVEFGVGGIKNVSDKLSINGKLFLREGSDIQTYGVQLGATLQF